MGVQSQNSGALPKNSALIHFGKDCITRRNIWQTFFLSPQYPVALQYITLLSGFLAGSGGDHHQHAPRHEVQCMGSVRRRRSCLQPQGGALYQPRAAPWVYAKPAICSLKGGVIPPDPFSAPSTRSYVSPLQGSIGLFCMTQGAALGWYVAAPLALQSAAGCPSSFCGSPFGIRHSCLFSGEPHHHLPKGEVG